MAAEKRRAWAVGECGRGHSRLLVRWRGVPGESQIRHGAVLLLRVGGQRDSRMQKRAWVALGEKGSAPGDKGDAGGCPSAFTDCSEKSRDRCSWGEFQQTGL